MTSFISALSLFILVLSNGCFTLPILDGEFPSSTFASLNNDLTTEQAFNLRLVPDDETSTLPDIDKKHLIDEHLGFELTTSVDGLSEEKAAHVLRTFDEFSSSEPMTFTTEQSDTGKRAYDDLSSTTVEPITQVAEHERRGLISELENETETKNDKRETVVELTTSDMLLFNLTSSAVAPKLYTSESTSIAPEVHTSESTSIAPKVFTSESSTPTLTLTEKYIGLLKDENQHKLEQKPELKPELKPEPKPELKPEPKPELKPELKPEQKPELKPEHEHEPKPEPEHEHDHEQESKPEEKPEPKPEQKHKPKRKNKQEQKHKQKLEQEHEPESESEQKHEPEHEHEQEQEPKPEQKHKPKRKNKQEQKHKPESESEQEPEPKPELKHKPEPKHKQEQKHKQKLEQKHEPESESEQKHEEEQEHEETTKSMKTQRKATPARKSKVPLEDKSEEDSKESTARTAVFDQEALNKIANVPNDFLVLDENNDIVVTGLPDELSTSTMKNKKQQKPLNQGEESSHIEEKESDH